MKEQIIKILKSAIHADGDIFVMWYEEGFNDIANEIETLIATEVERRIKEITREAWFEGMKQGITFTREDRDGKLRASKRMTFDDWLRSRLTENKQKGGDK